MDTRELPRVLSRKSVNTFARASITSLESIPQNTAPASSIVETTREQSPQLELHHMESSNSIDSIANDENQTKEETDWENKDELHLLKRLAEKYGYTIVDNRKGSRLGQNQKTDSVDSAVRAQKSKSMLERDDKIQQQVNHSTDHSERKEGETNRVNKRASFIRKISLLEKKKEGNNGLPVAALNETEVDKNESEMHKSELEKQRVGGTREEAVLSFSSKSSFKTQEINKDKPRISETGKIKAESETKKPPFEKTGKEERHSNENSETRIGRVELNTGNDEAKRDSKSTFERWLERKSAQKRESSAKESSQGNESEKRRDMCDQAFKKWLQLKKVRYRSASVSPRPSFQESRREIKRPKSGLSFETWMKGKGKVQPRSSSMTETTTHLPVKRAYSSGITYSEWIDSKRSQFKQSLGNAEEENSNAAASPNRVRLNGITFENWVEAKTEQFQIERVEKDTEKMRLEYEKEMEYERKLKNSNVKTFEDWLFEKEFEDRIRKTKEKKAKRKSRKNKTKYEEDSNLVYNMWLMNKHLSEMEKEEENLIALREEWKRKKKMQLKIGTEMEKAEAI
ncbi:ABC transporter F family member 4-like isoform X1 [Rhopilema esculentum]|uniref:ABC transporter F family member 4-like isoform X1 n=2 Tax=Rhopilema esculentum TaxID=499914 RepID=UPI0031D78A8B